MKWVYIAILVLAPFRSFSQEINLEYVTKHAIDLNAVATGNEDYGGFEKLDSLLAGIEIVMLGEQTHHDGTTFDTKIKLIKYLHDSLGFDVLAFESSMYESEKAWEQITSGGDVRLNLGKSINTFWSPLVEFKELADYVESTLDSENPLEIRGFDNQLGGGFAGGILMEEIKDYLQRKVPNLVNEELLTLLDESFVKKLWYAEVRKFKKKDAKAIVQHLEEVLAALNKIDKDDESEYWIRHLNNLSKFISDFKLGTEYRDQEMAKNLIWIKEKNPDKKIICWGATSHFLYNATAIELVKPNKWIEQHYSDTRMMGDFIKEKYQERVFTIGFTAYEGEYGTVGYGRKGEVEAAPINSLEFLLSQSEYENYLLPLGSNTRSNLISRPLGYRYIKTDISQMMDAVIFNRTMQRPRLDLEFFREIYPEHKYIK